MVAAVVIGLIVSVIDVLILLTIYFWVNYSRISNEEKRRFNKKLFGSGNLADSLKYQLKALPIINARRVSCSCLPMYSGYSNLSASGSLQMRAYAMRASATMWTIMSHLGRSLT